MPSFSFAFPVPALPPLPLPLLVLPLLALSLLALPMAATAQVFPDRVAIIDPLARNAGDTAGVVWFGGTRLLGEFARYSDGSGPDHRFSARTGGYAEIVRWDSTASLAIDGMMEMIADPNSDIGFNPRAIFWEEGILYSHRLDGRSALQAAFFHRCKHDIDNVETAVIHGVFEQRTLIYSSLMARWLLRPRPMLAGAATLTWGAALRNDYFLYLTDDRIPAPPPGADAGARRLVDAATLTGRIAAGIAGGVGLHLSGSLMLSLLRGNPADEDPSPIALGSVPFLELGLDVASAGRGAFTLFARGEWQPDAGIHPDPRPAKLFLIGLRVSGEGDMW